MKLRRWSSLVLACLAMAWLADWLFYDQPPGWTLALFYLAAAAIVALKGGPYLLRPAAVIAVAALSGLLAALALQPGPLVLLMATAALAAFAISIREAPAPDAVAMLWRLLAYALKAPLQAVLDLRPARRLLRRKGATPMNGALRRWTLPLAGSALFLVLFSAANPLISREMDEWGDAIYKLLTASPLNAGRIVFWGFTAMGAWALLRVRTLIARRTQPGPAPAIAMSAGRTSALVRCLALFNTVFALQTVLDITYLFGGLQLPEGMTYAEYAHRGSYPLVATALLAAAFVLAAYRPGPATRETTAARRLVLLWLAQNIFLTFSAAWRLHLYTGVYSLTRLRVAAGIWMLLVALGLAWIGLRVAAGKSNRWLVSRNLITTTIVLYMCCFVNFEGLIAWHNVRHSYEATGDGWGLDYNYLYTLGPEVIPPLLWLRGRSRFELPQGVLEAQQHALERMTGNWRGWTYRRMVLWNEVRPQ